MGYNVVWDEKKKRWVPAEGESTTKKQINDLKSYKSSLKSGNNKTSTAIDPAKTALGKTPGAAAGSKSSQQTTYDFTPGMAGVKDYNRFVSNFPGYEQEFQKYVYQPGGGTNLRRSSAADRFGLIADHSMTAAHNILAEASSLGLSEEDVKDMLKNATLLEKMAGDYENRVRARTGDKSVVKGMPLSREAMELQGLYNLYGFDQMPEALQGTLEGGMKTYQEIIDAQQAYSATDYNLDLENINKYFGYKYIGSQLGSEPLTQRELDDIEESFKRIQAYSGDDLRGMTYDEWDSGEWYEKAKAGYQAESQIAEDAVKSIDPNLSVNDWVEYIQSLNDAAAREEQAAAEGEYWKNQAQPIEQANTGADIKRTDGKPYWQYLDYGAIASGQTMFDVDGETLHVDELRSRAESSFVNDYLWAIASKDSEAISNMLDYALAFPELNKYNLQSMPNMTEAQINTALALSQKGDFAALQDYLGKIDYDISARTDEKMLENQQKWMEESPWNKALAYAASFPQNLAGGIAGIGDTLAAFLERFDWYNPVGGEYAHSAGSAGRRLMKSGDLSRGAIAQDIAENTPWLTIGGVNIPAAAFSGISSLGDSVLAYLLGGNLLQNAAMYGQSAGRTLYENQDAGNENADIQAALSGGIGMLTERLGFDSLFGGSIKKALLSNMSEEMAEELLNIGVDLALNPDNNKFEKLLDQYRIYGYTDKAEFAAVMDNILNVAESGIGGLFAGAAGSVPNAAATQIGDIRQGRTLQQNDTVGRMLEIASTLNLSPEVQEMIREQQQALNEQKMRKDGTPIAEVPAATPDIEADIEAETEAPVAPVEAAEEAIAEPEEAIEETPEEAVEAEAEAEQPAEEAPAESEPAPKKAKPPKLSAAKLGRIFRESMAKLDEWGQDVMRSTFVLELEQMLKERGFEGDVEGMAANVSRAISGDAKQMTPEVMNAVASDRTAWDLVSDLTGAIKTGGISMLAELQEIGAKGYAAAKALFEEEKKKLTAKAADGTPLTTDADETTVNGAAVTIDGVAEVNAEGQVTLNITDADGNAQTVSADDVEFGKNDADYAIVINAAGSMGRNADAMVKAYQPGQDGAEFVMAFRRAMEYGADGRSLKATQGSGSLSGLTPSQINAAWALGKGTRDHQNQAFTRRNAYGISVGNVDVSGINMESLNKAQRASVNAVSRIARAVGFNVKFVESIADADGQYMSENGRWDPDTMTMTLDVHAGANTTAETDYAMMQTAGHELTHFIRDFADADLWNGYQEFVLGHLSEKMTEAQLENEIGKRIAAYAKLGKELTREGAIEEIIADASGRALMNITEADIRQLAQSNPTLLQRMKNFIQKWIGDLKKLIKTAYQGEAIKTDAARAMNDVIDELSERWNKLLVNAARNRNVASKATAGIVVTDNGAIVSKDVADVMNGDNYTQPDNGLFSLRETDAWAESHKALYPNDTNFADNLALIQNFDRKVAADSVLRYLVPHGKIPKSVRGPLRNNQEYVYTFDMDTKCERTYQFLAYRDAVQKRIGRQLKEDESRNLIELMRAYGQMIPCTYCYVEGKRMKLAELYMNYLEKNSKSIMGEQYSAEQVFDVVEKARTIVSGYLDNKFNIAENYELDTALANEGFEGYRDFMMPISEAEAAEGIFKRYNITDKAAKRVVQGFIAEWVYNRRMDLPMNLVNTDADFRADTIDEKVLSFHDLATKAAQGGAKAKGIENYEPYVDQLKNVSLEDKRYMVGMGGIRKHSSNDFQIQNVQDYMLFFMDLAADKRGGIDWTGHTYTKNLDYARIFAPTNDRINVSIAMYGDDASGIRPNTQEGVNWKELQEVRKQYKNVGAMAMVVNNDQLSFALNSDWIDMIIPFHASGMKKSLYYDVLAWTDYTSKQGERLYNKGQMIDKLREMGFKVNSSAKAGDIKQLYAKVFAPKTLISEKTGKPVAPHFFPGETIQHGQVIPGHNNDAARYFELCEQYATNPRFYGIKVKDANGNLIDVTKHPAYLKLIKETARTDSKQEPIVAKFDMAYVNKAMENFHGYSNLSDDAYGIVDEFVREYVGKNRKVGYLTERAIETRDIIREMAAAEQQKRESRRVAMLESINKADENVVQEYQGKDNSKFSIRETTDGRKVVSVKDDILAGIYTSGRWTKEQKQQAKKAARDALENAGPIYSEGIPFYITGVTRDEFPASEYVWDTLGKKRQKLADRFRIASEAEDLIIATVGWKNENLTKDRKDFERFTKGKVYMDIHGRKYEAIVVAGVTKDGMHILYDLVDMNNAQFDMKKEAISPAIQANNAFVPYSEMPSNKDSVAQKAGQVKPNSDSSRFQPRALVNTELSDRELLADAAYNVARTDAERDHIERYREKIAGLNRKQQRLEEYDQKIIDLQNKEQTQAVKKELQAAKNVARQLRKDIAEADATLLNIEATKMFKTMIEYGRAQHEKQVTKEVSDHWRKRLEEEHVIAHRERYQAALMADVRKLYKWTTHPTNKGYVPEILREPLAVFLESIDMSSRRKLKGGPDTQADEAFKAALDNLRSTIADIRRWQKGEDEGTARPMGYIDLPEGMADKIDLLARSIKKTLASSANKTDTPINRMTAAQLKEMAEIVSIIKSGILKMNQLFANSRYESVATASNDTITDMNAMSARIKTNKVLAALNSMFNWKNTTPYYAFQRLGRGGKAIFEGLQAGWDKMAQNSAQLIEYAEKAFTKKQARDWSKEIKSVKLDSGETVQMTVSQIMSLYCLAKRDQAIGHLMGGGMRISDIDAGRGNTISQTEDYILTEEDVNRMIRALTKEQRTVADALQAFMNSTCSDWGNEISMKRFGYKMFTEEHYFPIETDKNNLTRIDDKKDGNTSLFRLLNMSATKPLTEGANNAIIIRDIFDVFSNHASDMAKYNALALPILDFIKWYNFVEKVDVTDANGKPTGKFTTNSIQKALERVYGNDAKSYVLKFVQDLNAEHDGGRDDQFLTKLMGQAKAGSVNANMRVAFLQITSLPRAAYAINPKYLLAGMAKLKSLNPMTAIRGSEAQDKIGILKWKKLGFYSTDVARSTRSMVRRNDGPLTTIRDLLMKPAEFGDNWVSNIIYEAAKAEMKDKHPNLTPGSKAYETMLNNRVREIVYKTQVVDSTMTRSQFMRSKGLATLLTAFMSEPTLAVNMLNESIQEAVANKRTGMTTAQSLKAVSGKAVRAATVFAVTAAFSAIVESLFDAFRDDDEYEEFMEKFADSLKGNIADNLNIFAMLPVLKDLISIAQGYESGSLITQAFTQYKDVQEAITAYQEGKRPIYNVVYSILKAVASTTGVGVQNATRDGIALYNTLLADAWKTPRIQTYENSKSDAATALYAALQADDAEKTEYIKQRAEINGVALGDMANKIADLVEADYIAGKLDDAEATEILAEYGGKDAATAKEKVLEWQYERDTGRSFGKMKEDYIAGDIERAEAAAQLQQYGGKNADEAEEQIDRWDYNIAYETSDGYTKYWRMYYALENGGDFRSEARRWIDSGVKKGDIARSIAGRYKAQYLAIKGTPQGNAMLEMLLDLYEAIGYDRAYERNYINTKWELDD